MSKEAPIDWRKPPNSTDIDLVNAFFGLRELGMFKPGNIPEKINFENLWNLVSPAIDRHPKDRELFVGLDNKGGSIQITEETEGITYEELYKKDPLTKLTGQVRPEDRHLIELHTHVKAPPNTVNYDLPADLEAAFCRLKVFPKSSLKDLSALVVLPGVYAMAIIDISKTNDTLGGRFFAAIKTKQASSDHYQKILDEMEFAERWYTYDHSIAKKLIFSDEMEITNLFQSDEHWSNSANLAIYRGLIIKDHDGSLNGIRWDIFYKKLMSHRWKVFGLF